jgi:O-succinylbenzoic acid--CoA ligase
MLRPDPSFDAPVPAASLRPLTGSAREIERLVTDWLGGDSVQPLVVRTSGSTGEPKQVALSASALLRSAAATLDRLGGPGGWVLALPAHYVAGLQVIVRSHLSGTTPAVLGEHPDLTTATAALPDGRRYLAVVPTQLYRWMSNPADVEALRRYDAVLVGGGAADPALVERALAGGVPVVMTYGMSETCGGCVSDGVALDGVAVALGSDGRIRLAGPMLFDGYVGEPELTAEVLRDGWLYTPDLGRLDPDGRLEVLGRVDDMVISGGVNVSVAAVERRIAAMAEVAACAVIAEPDAEWGSRLVAYVVPSAAGSSPALEQVRDFVAAAHPRAWAPRELVVVEDRLPMLESGKIDRRSLRRTRGGLSPS